MEIPQQQRLFEAEGRKPTHDFLSLYSHSTTQQDPRPTSQGALKTHDFLLPLERVENAAAKEENPAEVLSSLEKAPPATPSSVEHILPGGIGTYSISHVSYYNQRVPKPEGSPKFSVAQGAQASSTEKNDEHSNCSSYTGSGFTLWEESAIKKGKTGKENGERSNVAIDPVGMVGHWTTTERPSQLSTNGQYNSFSSLSSSQPTGNKGQSFMDMIKSAKGCSQDDNIDEEDEFVLKKESPSPVHKGELRVKVDGKSTDQKANTPRSKHSATEQRRRSKINDRFQMLRGLIPHGDQKRDKASFLLEVIEYVQFLQDKVKKYEGPYQAWNQEPGKLVPWKNSSRPAESYVDQSRAISGAAGPPALLFAANLDEKSFSLSPTIAHNAVESEINSATTFKVLDHNPGITSNAIPFPMSLQPNVFNSGQASGEVAPIAPRIRLDDDNMETQHQSHHTRSRTSDGFVVAGDKLKEQEMTIEGGTINISSVYSQGLLNTLTQALQSSGLDLSQASISVQIELGKQASRRQSDPTSTDKDNKVGSHSQGITRTRVPSGEECDEVLKKLRSSKS